MWRPDKDKLKKKSAAVVVAGCRTTGGLAENEGEALCFFATAPDFTVCILSANNGLSGPAAELFVLEEANIINKRIKRIKRIKLRL